MSMRIKNNELAFALIGAVFLATLLFLTTAIRSFEREIQGLVPTSIIASARAKPSLIEFDFGNGLIRKFEGPTDNTPFPLIDALMSISQTASLPVVIVKGTVKSIGKVGDHGVWRIWLNNQIQLKSPELLSVAANDYYILRFQSVP